MKLFYKRYLIIILLLNSTNSFVTALEGNVTHEPKIIAEVLTTFLKVPWIDLKSSWTDTVVPSCKNDIITLFESANDGEMWAIQMLDAASKTPAGILIGNIWDLGMFDECINVRSYDNPANIQGQHCMVSLSMPTKFFQHVSTIMRIQKLNVYNPNADEALSLSLSVCVPSSCGTQDIHGLVNASIKNMPELNELEIDVAKVACANFEPPNELPIGTILTISFFMLVAVFLLFCTVCDFILKIKSDGTTALKNAAKFSVYTNAIKLLATESNPDTIPGIHGIRVLNMALVILGHRVFTVLLQTTVNLSDTNTFLQSLLMTVILMLPLAVDTFFLISGFIVTHLLLKRLRSGKTLNIFVLQIHRYLRLTPCVAALLLFVIFILPHLGSGPIWKTVFEATVTNCQKNWWTNLLYIQNIVNTDEMCLLHTWYLAVDTQLFTLLPVILYPLFYRPKLGLGILGLFLTTSFLLPAVQLLVNRTSAIFATNKSNPILMSEFLKYVLVTYNRALPYFVGILLGYDVSYNKRQISKTQIICNWVMSISFVILCGWVANNIQPKAIVYDVIWEMIYVSVARLLWSVSMAWVLYACTQGYGGPITEFLSLPIFVPLSRMSYCLYLVHFVLQVATTATQRTAEYMQPFKVIHQYCGDLLLSTVIAFIFCLSFESPIVALQKIIMKSGQSSDSKENDYIAKSESHPNSADKRHEDLKHVSVLESTHSFSDANRNVPGLVDYPHEKTSTKL